MNQEDWYGLEEQLTLTVKLVPREENSEVAQMDTTVQEKTSFPTDQKLASRIMYRT